jgi:hypothetical protein
VIVIETPRLFLRHFTLDDLDALTEILGDHDNMRFFPNRFERKDAVEWIEKNMRRYAEDGVGGWALILKSDNKLAGHSGLVRREIDGAKEIEVGYVLARHAQGQGIATDPSLHELRIHNSWRSAGDFADPSGESSIAPRGRTQWDGSRKRNRLPRNPAPGLRGFPSLI